MLSGSGPRVLPNFISEEKKSRKGRERNKPRRPRLRISFQHVSSSGARIGLTFEPEDPRVLSILNSLNEAEYDRDKAVWTIPVAAQSALVSRFYALGGPHCEVVIQRPKTEKLVRK